jgi:phosphoglycerol transferase
MKVRNFNKSYIYLVVANLLNLFAYFKIIGLRPSEFQFNIGTGDKLFILVNIKTLIETGWVSSNQNLGFPDSSFGNFPNFDLVNYVILKVLTIFSQNPAVVITLFSAVLAQLTFIWGYLLARGFCNKLNSVIFALIISLNIWRLQREFAHVFLANLTPLMSALIVGIYIVSKESKLRKIKYFPIVVAMHTFFMVGSGIYWLVCSLIIIVTSLTIGLFLRNIRFLTSFYIVIFLASTFLFVGIFSGAFNFSSNSLFKRFPFESEIYAGRFSTLFLPSSFSGIQFLSDLRVSFNSGISDNFEGSSELSLISVIANWIVLVLIVYSIFNTSKLNIAVKYLVFLWLIFVLLYINGGFSLLFSTFIIPEIRAWGRFAAPIFILSTLILFSVISQLKFNKNNQLKIKLISLSMIIIFLADLNFNNLRVDTIRGRNIVNDLQPIVAEVESKLSEGCAIYQYPFVPYPENPPVEKMTDYDHFLPYLFSRSVLFSYGAMKGNDLKNRQLLEDLQFNTNDFLKLESLGFCAIEIDNFGLNVEQADKIKGWNTNDASKEVLTTSSGRWKFIIF